MAASRCVTRTQAAPEPPAVPPEPPPVPASPLEIFAKPAAPAAERMDAAAIEPVAGAVPPPLPPTESAKPTEPAEPAKSFEERFGANWVVWIGGLALALGGIFLVQYSIEAGLIGPKVRIFLGGLFAAGLIAAGEWTRRREFSIGLDNIPTAHIPGILTAAGTTVAFATVYAAYALYGFLVPGSAFVLLGMVALATLAAALLHGPALAALGQVGAFVTPLLIVTPQPNYLALYVYLAVVTAASFALARARLWRWLAITAVVFGVLWAFPGILDDALRADAGRALSRWPASRSPPRCSSPACSTVRMPRRAGSIRCLRARSPPGSPLPPFWCWCATMTPSR